MNKTITLIIFFIGLIYIPVKAQITKLQCVYIYNFTKYIDWPASYKSGNFVIGVLGNDAPILTDLKVMVNNKKIENQEIVVKVFSSVDFITKCHILFIPHKESDKIGSVLLKLNNSSTLIITEKEGMAKNGGASINFIIKDNVAKFELNKNNAIKKNLIISTTLERLAVNVY